MPEIYFDGWVAQRYEDDGGALELGVGTGRLALPLSRRGIRVDGIELSAEMIEQLRAQRGSADIDVTIGNFSTTTVNGTFTLAYLPSDRSSVKEYFRAVSPRRRPALAPGVVQCC